MLLRKSLNNLDILPLGNPGSFVSSITVSSSSPFGYSVPFGSNVFGNFDVLSNSLANFKLGYFHK